MIAAQTNHIFENQPIPLRCELGIGDQIDTYQIEQVLGEGTFGIVYKVSSNKVPGVFALKLLKLWEVPNQGERQKVLQRFKREFECGQIESPYLVRTLSYGCFKGNPYLLMEYCANQSLAKYIKSLPPIEEINRIGIEILLGLQDLHSNGIFHRDIKPDNILFDEQHKVKLTDFGIAGFKQQRLTVTNIFGEAKNIFGTYAYIAPEQADNRTSFKSMNASTDIFSFGVMLFEIFSGGIYPFGSLASHGDLANYMRRAKEGNWEKITKHKPDLPKYWQRIIEGCLHPDYQTKRFQRVKDIIEILLPKKLSSFSKEVQFEDEVCLKIMHGEEKDKVYNLNRLLSQEEGLLTVGWFDKHKPDKNNLGIIETTTAFISNYHATLEKISTDPHWYIRDGQWRQKEGQWAWYPSKNGVLVNSKVVDERGVKLQIGDIIIIGDTTLKVVIQ